MNRAVEKIVDDESHDMMTFAMEGEREYQEYARVFPEPLPSTHRLAHKWETNERGQKVLFVRVVPLKAPAPAGTGAPANTPPAVDPAAAEARRRELDAKTKADLQTIGATVGLDLSGELTKAQMVAQIIEAEAAKAANAGR